VHHKYYITYLLIPLFLERNLCILAVFIIVDDAWIEVHHNMPMISDSIKSQLEGALVIGDEPVSPTCAVVDIFD